MVAGAPRGACLLLVLLLVPRPGHAESPLANCGKPGLHPSDGRRQWCCGNSTWSSFDWRARAALVPTNRSARLSFAIKGRLHLLGLQGAAATAPGQWTGWAPFRPNNTVDCAAYPNQYLDPVDQLVLTMQLTGVGAHATADVVLEVRPAGGRGGERPYALNASLAHLQDDGGPRSSLQLPLRLGRANLTGVPLLLTEREVNEDLWRAMPAAPAPVNFTIVQGYHGLDKRGRCCRSTSNIDCTSVPSSLF